MTTFCVFISVSEAFHYSIVADYIKPCSESQKIITAIYLREVLSL
jgi:hypothetical protein